MGRSAPRQLEIRVERDPDAPSARLTLSVSIDRAEAYPIRFGLQGRALVNIPPATTPGLRVELVWGGDIEPPPRIEALILDKRPTPWALVLLAFFSTSGAVLLFVRWRGTSFAIAAGFWTAGLVTLACQPALTFLRSPRGCPFYAF